MPSLVSIIIPVFNAGVYLRPAVESALGQTWRELEVLVVDDGSTDRCLDSLKGIHDPRLSIHRQENQGKSVALNYALEVLKGDYYVIQDADDLSYPPRVESLLNLMQHQSDLAAVFSGHDLILNGKHMAPRFAGKSREECRKDILRMRMPAHDPTVMFRVKTVQGFRYEPALRIGQGFDYILQVGEKYPMAVLGECLYSYRVHNQSGTRQKSGRRRAMIRLVQERAAERRGLPAPRANNRASAVERETEYGVVTHFMESVLDLRRARRLTCSFRAARQCLSLHPGDPRYYKPLLYFTLPLFWIDKYRSRKRQAGSIPVVSPVPS